LLAHRFLVQHAQHGVLAVNGRHDGNAEIDRPSVVFHAETPVLRHAALGNIELAHDLDTGNDRRMMFLAYWRHGLREHAIDAELDDHRGVASLDMEFPGPGAEGREKG